MDDEIPPDIGYSEDRKNSPSLIWLTTYVVYELGQLTFDAKTIGEHEQIRSTAGIYYKVTYMLQIEYGRKAITMSLPVLGDEIDVDYEEQSQDADDSIDDPYGSDIMEEEDDYSSDHD